MRAVPLTRRNQVLSTQYKKPLPAIAFFELRNSATISSGASPSTTLEAIFCANWFGVSASSEREAAKGQDPTFPFPFFSLSRVFACSIHRHQLITYQDRCPSSVARILGDKCTASGGIASSTHLGTRAFGLTADIA